MMENASPRKYPTVIPYLIVDNAGKLIDFLKQTFNAEEVERHNLEDGKIMHAELKLGDSMIMVSDAGDKYPAMNTMIHIFWMNAIRFISGLWMPGPFPLWNPKTRNMATGVRG